MTQKLVNFQKSNIWALFGKQSWRPCSVIIRKHSKTAIKSAKSSKRLAWKVEHIRAQECLDTPTQGSKLCEPFPMTRINKIFEWIAVRAYSTWPQSFIYSQNGIGRNIFSRSPVKIREEIQIVSWPKSSDGFQIPNFCPKNPFVAAFCKTFKDR